MCWGPPPPRPCASPRHQTSYLYVKAGAAKSSNVRRAFRTVDGRGNRNAWVDGGECSVLVRAVLVSLKARAAKPPSRERRDRASAERPLRYQWRLSHLLYKSDGRGQMDRRRAAGALLALAACIACSAAAPTAGNHSALDLYDGAVVEGCYYNFQHYSEGDRIMTNEPCLNCTCHNRMLMCYLRVCPFTKAIGQDCTVEKRADQCCPIVTCPDVPVDLLTSTSTSSPAEYGATGVGKFDKYGCSIDGKYLPEGAKVPPTPNKPCEHCYCIRNMTTCVMQECTLHVDGCTPIYHKDVCCPVRYSCDHPEDEIPLLDDMTTTVRPTPGFILTTPTTISPITQITQDCVHDDQIFADGALIKTEKACEHCYCMKGDIVCVVQECGTPMENEGKNCTSLPPREGQCCPDTYICEGDESSTEYSRDFTTNLPIEELTTLTPPRRVGVEGSGYRNEPDEIPFTELPSSVSGAEGSGEQKPLEFISETSVDDDNRQHTTGEHTITTDLVSHTTQKITSESQTEQSTPKSDEGKEQLDIIDYEKSTIQSITEESPEKIPQDTSLPVIEESEIFSTESNKQFTEIQSEKETTGPYKETWKTTSSSDLEQKTKIPTELVTQEITPPGPDKKEYEEGLSETTSSSVYVESDNVTPEKNVIETTTLDSKTSLESEIYGSTPVDSHTLTLEEVEKEEFEQEKHIIGTDKSTEEFTTESHEYVSSPDIDILLPETVPPKTHDGVDEGFDKEITDNHEFIPVTTGLSTIGVTTVSYKEEYITEKELEEEMYETPHHIVTNVPHIKPESSTPVVDEIVTQEVEQHHTYGGQEILSSIPNVTELAETSTSNTEAQEYITSIANTPASSSESTQKSVSDETILGDLKTSTITSALEEKDDITTTVVESKLSTTTASEVETSKDYLATVVPDLNKESQTFTTVKGEEFTAHDIKYDISSELPPSEVISDDTTTEPDKGLNTIPAGGIDKNLVTSVPLVSASDSYTTKGDDIPVTTDGFKKDDIESEKVDNISTELYIEKEPTTIYYIESHETTELPEEKETKHTISPSGDYSHITEQASLSTTEFISSTTVPEHEFIKQSSTELAIEKTDIPVTSTVNQGENEIHEDVSVPGRIPGEGDCLQNGVTYRNESNVPSTHNCHTGCKCISSIIKCDPIICSPPPDYMDNCQPTYDPPDACCPTYECTHISKETMPPQSQSQMSGTEAPLQPPSFECRGDQCEVSEDKIRPTLSYETCTGGKCKVDLDKKMDTSECGPQGCHDVSEIPVPQGIDLGQSDKCTGEKCISPQESCDNGECELAQIKPAQPCVGDNCVVQSETLPTSVLEKCEIEGNCKEISLTPSLPCEGDRCTVTEETSGTDDNIICKEEGGCQEAADHVTYGCEGESCRRKEIVGTETKLPTMCTGTECLEQSHTPAEHGFDIYEGTTLVPLEDVTQTEKQIAHVTVADTKDQTTLEPEDIVYEISEITTRLPAPSTDEIIRETDVKLESSSEGPVKKENELTETAIDTSTSKQATTVTEEYATEKPVDIKEDSLNVNLEDHATKKLQDITTQKVEIEEHEIGTKTPVDIQITLTPHEPSEYITKSDKKEVIQQSTQESTDIDKNKTVSPETIKSTDIEKGETTEPYGAVFEKETESPEFLTGKDRDNEVSDHSPGDKATKDESDISDFSVSTLQYKTTESPSKQEKPDYISGVHVTESNTIDTTLSQQFISEQSYSTEEQGLQEIVTQEQYLLESDKTEATGMEKQVTESIINVDTVAPTTASEIIDTVTLGPYEEISKIDTPKVSDKHEDSYQRTTESLENEMLTSTKSVDSVVYMVTTPKPVEVEGETTTTKSEIHVTAPDKESLLTYEPQKEQKLEFSTTSDIDTEEYVTEEHSLSGLSEEKLTTTIPQPYVTDLEESITGVPVQSEVIPQELESTAAEVPTKKTEVNNEEEKDSFTTESPNISDLEEVVTDPVRSTDVYEQEVLEIQKEVDFEKLTTAATISPFTAEDKTEGINLDVQKEVSKEDYLSPTTERIKMTEKEVEKVEKPVYEDITTEIPLSIPEIHEDIEKVTEYKDISLLENTETELPEHYIPTQPDFEKSIAKVTTEEDKKHTMTTLEDKTSYTENETGTTTSGIVFNSHSEVPVQEDYHAHEDVSKVPEPATTITSILEASEPFTVVSEVVTTEVPQKDSKLPEFESHATIVSPVKEIKTETPVLLELETKPTSIIPSDIEEQEITSIPVTSKLEHETDSKLQIDLTTEHTKSELLGSSVSESEIENKDIEITVPTATTTQEPIREYSISTEGYKVDKETDILSTSFSEEDKLTTPKIIILPDLTPTSTEQPSATIVHDYGTSGPEFESKVEVSTELSYIEQTHISEFLSHEPEDLHKPLPEIYSPEQEEMQTVSPNSMTTEAPKVVTTTEDVINKQKDMSTESSGDIDKQKISPIYTEQTTERDVTFSEKESEYGAENTTPLLLEYTSTPKHEYSESTSDLVELEEHTHKHLEESPTTPRLSSDEETTHAESTEKILVELSTSFSPIIEEKTTISVTTDKFSEETAKQTHPSSGEETSHDVTTEKVLVEPTTSVRPSLEKESSHGEESGKVAEDSATTPHLTPEEEIGYTVATDKILEESATSQYPSFEVDKIHTITTDKISEDTETTHHLSSEKDTNYFAVTDKFLEEEAATTQLFTEKEISLAQDTENILEETATTLLSDVGKETSYPGATEKISGETITTLPNFDKETSHSENTDRYLEGTVTTPRFDEKTSHTLSTDNILEETETTPRPSYVEETSQSEITDKIIEETEITPSPSSVKVTSHSYATDKILEGTEITPLPSYEEEISHPAITDKILEETGTTERASIEEEISHAEATDKIMEEIATTLHPNIEKESGYVESTEKVAEDSVPTSPISTDEEASHVESADKVLVDTVTTQRFEEEVSHELTTERILEESAMTAGSSSEEKVSHTVTTEKALEEAGTSLRPSFEEEIGQNIEKISEEWPTTPRHSSEAETGYDVTVGKTTESTTSHRPGFEVELGHVITTEKVLEESITTPLPSSEEDNGQIVVTDKILEETETTQHPRFEEEIIHPGDTDKIVDEIAVTLHPTIEKEPGHYITTENTLDETSTLQGPSFEKDISHTITTDKISEDIATTLRPISEDETIYAKTTVTSEVITTPQISIQHETSHAEVTEKILEDIATTSSVSLEDEKIQDQSQKLKPEIVTEKTIDEQIEKDADRPTEIKEDSETPVKGPTETSLLTETSIPDISSQSTTTHVEESSSLSSVLQETDVKYTTESKEKEISTETPIEDVEKEKTHPISEEKPSKSSTSQEMFTPGEEIVSSTTKVTTMSVEEYVTTHAPAPVDKFTKPKEKPTESAQSTAAPELPKPSEIQPTDEVPIPEEESHFPPSGVSGYGGETDYGDEDQALGPGTCRYGGKVYVSAQQIPRDDPCDFCFCFRSDIICLQQSCPPPIHGCHEEPIQGFCCPRYECPVSMATTLNVTTTTTTTTTTLPPHFPTHSYKGAAHRRGCQIKGHTYKVGEVVRASSGPCLHCTCGGDGQMKCDPKACTPEPMLRQMIAAAVSAKRRR
ncbi:hypothetical protein K1T71_003949 [Dendrolimus kikuchii]|uniref:Uncharacterized protein n=1 Tax=Dendrolimus kikuchii TaxID=765133 RepID=A0ACC1D9N2_9NEOP|nr:hypothetical protein K1T71_003949 [Dendrolimus kikuchii]